MTDTDSTKHSLFLIDGHSYIYRAYYAIRGLSTSRGLPTNAIFGFTKMLLKIIKEKDPDFLAVVFDSPGPTERQEVYDSYKIHRPEMPDDLKQQIPYIKDIVRSLRVASFEVQGFEADDIMATVAKEAQKQGLVVSIVTGDKDLNQLLSDSITVYDTMKDRRIEAEDIKKRFGVEPERLPEIMALMGDVVDNIPGVPGVGEKTAVSLLKKYGNLHAVLENPEAITKTKLRSSIIEHRDNILLSFKLATLNTHVPLEFDFSDMARKEPDWETLTELFRQCQFNNLLSTLPSSRKSSLLCTIIHNHDELKAFINQLEGRLSISTIGSIPEAANAHIVGMALSAEGLDDSDKAYYIPAFQSQDVSMAPFYVLYDSIKHVCEDHEIKKVCHNSKYDMTLLNKAGITLKGVKFDTMLASYLLNPTRQNHDIESAAVEHLGIKKTPLNKKVGKKNLSGADISTKELANYGGESAVIILELEKHLAPLIKEKELDKVLFSLEMPLCQVLAQMENTGVKIDISLMKTISSELKEKLRVIEQEIYSLADCTFNINSPKQLQDVLFTRLGLKPVKKTKTGYSTDVSVLQQLAQHHDLPLRILDQRNLAKLKNTYVDTLPHLVNSKTGRLHPTFNQTATATGRLSTSEPNLQNIPVRGQWGKRIREAFIAEKDHLLLSCDYSQIELRILAHVSRDENLIRAFNENKDIHTMTASALFGVREEEITPDMRRKAKTVNFGIIYGISPYGLSKQLGITQIEAAQFIEKYFDAQSMVKDYIDISIKECEDRGYVTTLFGRRRDIPEILSSHKNTHQLGERLAVNTPIQGTAADIIKKAMITISHNLEKNKMKSRMILQIHDELLFEVPEEEMDVLEIMVKEEMENAVNLSVPLTVETGKGTNWAQAAHS
jgi:DNA polymerase-1